MTSINPHPMDDFPVRPLNFDLGRLKPDELLWSRTCPAFSVFLNAFGVHVPYFERYLVRSMRLAREQIDDPVLRRDVTAIIGQEAHHAKSFILLNAILAKRYPKVAEYEARVRDDFAERARTDSLKRMVGFTAGYETFTFLAGAIILQNHHRWLKDSHPVVNAMWVWHQVEEVEHGAVAFEVYRHLYGKHEFYRKWMILVAFTHIAAEAIKTYVHMCRVEGWYKSPRKALACTGFFCNILFRLISNALPAFGRGYNPRRHPIVTDQQSPIQIAWRRYEKAGGDVLAIDREKMASLLGVAQET
jgi:predicted metal-dependent hydrolase